MTELFICTAGEKAWNLSWNIYGIFHETSSDNCSTVKILTLYFVQAFMRHSKISPKTFLDSLYSKELFTVLPVHITVFSHRQFQYSLFLESFRKCSVRKYASTVECIPWIEITTGDWWKSVTAEKIPLRKVLIIEEKSLW